MMVGDGEGLNRGSCQRVDLLKRLKKVVGELERLKKVVGELERLRRERVERHASMNTLMIR